MGTKSEELARAARGEGCLGKAADDEPLFVLRAQDASAPSIVRQWVSWNVGTLAPEKREEALALAARMEAWAVSTGRGKRPT